MMAPVAFAVLAFAGPQDDGRVLLPGLVDLPVLQGAAWSADCGGMRGELGADGHPVDCVTAPIERIDALVWAYVGEAKARGWEDASGAANAIWMQKARAGDRCQKLTIAGFWDFRRSPEPRPGQPGYVAVVHDSDILCQARPVQ